MGIKIEKIPVMAQPRQLKANWSVESGVIYAPRIPSIFMKQTPTTVLHSLHTKYVLWKETYPNETKQIDQVTEVMQEQFPGPYTIVEAYNPKRGCFELQAKFADPKQETLWRIKYG